MCEIFTMDLADMNVHTLDAESRAWGFSLEIDGDIIAIGEHEIARQGVLF